MKVTMIPIVNGAFGTVPKGLEKGAGRIWNRRTNRDHPNYSLVEISKNTEKCSRDLRRLTATENPMKDHQLKKLWNTKMTVLTIVIGALGIVTKGLVQRLEDLEMRGLVETIQTTALLRSAKKLRVLETWGDLLSLKLQWKATSYHWREKFSKLNNNGPRCVPAQAGLSVSF